MRILLVGDLHGAISLVGRTVATLKRRFDFAPDVIVQVGDWGFFADMGEWPRALHGEIALPTIPTYVVHGNHDGRAKTLAAMAGIARLPYLHVFPAGGDIWTIHAAGEAVTLLGVGGAYDAPTTTPSDGIAFTERDPAIALERRYGSPWRFGSPGIRTLWERVNPPLIICGHYHQELTHIEGSRTLRVLPLAQEGAAVWDTMTGQVTAFAFDR